MAEAQIQQRETARRILWDWKGAELLPMPLLDELVDRISAAMPRVSASVAPPNHALIQLLEAALLHPESAEGNIRQVIEALSGVAPAVDYSERAKQLVHRWVTDRHLFPQQKIISTHDIRILEEWVASALSNEVQHLRHAVNELTRDTREMEVCAECKQEQFRADMFKCADCEQWFHRACLRERHISSELLARPASTVAPQEQSDHYVEVKGKQ